MALPFIISIPHGSGRIPDALEGAFALSQDEIDESVDWGTEEIFGSLDASDTVCAQWSRLVVDLNRAPERRDIKGVVAGVDYFGRRVYRPDREPGNREIEGRLNGYYWPYHRRLEDALRNEHACGLFDGHSLNGVGPAEAPDAGCKRKDIVLSNNGDHNGETTRSLGRTTCPVGWLNLMKEAFLNAGFSVALNDPYTAGYITAHYGRILAEEGKFAIQVEINQDLYIHPVTGRIHPRRLAETRSRIQGCFEEIARRV